MNLAFKIFNFVRKADSSISTIDFFSYQEILLVYGFIRSAFSRQKFFEKSVYNLSR